MANSVIVLFTILEYLLYVYLFFIFIRYCVFNETDLNKRISKFFCLLVFSLPLNVFVIYFFDFLNSSIFQFLK